MKFNKKLGLFKASAAIALAGMSAFALAEVSCEVSYINDWGSGYQMNVDVTNSGSSSISSWQIALDFGEAPQVTGGWNVSLSTSGNIVTASDAGWNGSLSPGESTSFGFQGNSDGSVNEPTCTEVGGNNPTPTDVPPTPTIAPTPTSTNAPTPTPTNLPTPTPGEGGIVCAVTNENIWSSGYQLDVSVTNTSTAVSSWEISLCFPEGANRSGGWNASFSDDGNCVNVSNGSWNGNLNSGESTSFGIQGGHDGSFESPSCTGNGGTGPTPTPTITPTPTNPTPTPIGPTPTPIEPPTPTPTPGPTGVPGERVNNPFVGVKWYVDPIWSAKAAGEPGGSAISGYNTAVWMDRIGAIAGPADGDGLGLRGHLDQAVSQGAGMFMFVVYDLPNRDCAALASNGELRISQNGFARYKAEYIDAITAIISDATYEDLRIVAIVEVDSLPNLVTNANIQDCQEAAGPGGYVDGIRYALQELGKIDNVYSYVDIAHSGWLGWSSNFGPAINLIGNAVSNLGSGINDIAGFVSNSANYTPVEEPYLPNPDLQVGGQQVKSANFYEWNPYFEELKFVTDWRNAMISYGLPSSIGMLIDTGRNGWGGPNRPSAASSSSDLNGYVNGSRIDRRAHRGNWCNQPGGVGYRPTANPHPGVDAYVWVKPQGESDGISEENFEQDPNDPAKQYDAMCDPDKQSRYDSQYPTGSIDNAPHAGRWFPAAFKILIDNAYPPL